MNFLLRSSAISRRLLTTSIKRTFSSSSFASDDQNLRVNIDVHYGEGAIKRFVVTNETTLGDFVKNVSEERRPGKKLQLAGKEGNVEKTPATKSTNFRAVINGKPEDTLEPIYGQKILEVITKNNVKLEDSQHKKYSLGVDYYGEAAYFDNHPLDGVLYDYRLPIQDSQVIKSFANQMIDTLNAKKKTAFTVQDLEAAMQQTLKNYMARKNKVPTDAEQVAATLEHQEALEEKVLSGLQKDLKRTSTRLIKISMAVVLFQWIFLFYLTYVSYGWDVTEPMGYLIGLALECAGLYYFLRKGKFLDQRVMYDNASKRTKSGIFNRHSTNPELDVATMNAKRDLWRLKNSL